MSSMYEQYRARSAAAPKARILEDYVGTLRTHGDQNAEMFRVCFQMLADHAMHIDSLKAQLNETNEFMKWVSETHREAFSEYKAVRDLSVASGGDGDINKLLSSWGES